MSNADAHALVSAAVERWGLPIPLGYCLGHFWLSTQKIPLDIGLHILACHVEAQVAQQGRKIYSVGGELWMEWWDDGPAWIEPEEYDPANPTSRALAVLRCAMEDVPNAGEHGRMAVEWGVVCKERGE